ncbi:hypothetical protein BGZ96_003020 [Linnemannia gamsii]|uniref:F-box domain-containing protein n=1 Tax=Linnemannia gamsii TaxID=64522 RepID=A0ABQ7K8A8_9FUNG|nr:hypothetical protein BGZ96_003020 [Linnemannia gamsii]
MSAPQGISSFRSNLLLIPEMVSHIASFLNHPDLYSTVQVSRDWDLAFYPHLWETIDDRLYAWPRILSEKEPAPNIVQTEHWIQSAFAKHHMHIKHLHICSTILVKAAAHLINNSSSNSNNWNLKSMSLDDDMKKVSTKADIPIDRPDVMKQVTALIQVNTPTLFTLTISDTYLSVCNTDYHTFFNSIRGIYNLVEFNCGDGFEF